MAPGLMKAVLERDWRAVLPPCLAVTVAAATVAGGQAFMAFSHVLACALFILSLVTAALLLRRQRLPRVGKELQERYQLSAEGFLMAAQPHTLPLKFSAWEDIATRLPELIRSRRLCEAVERSAAAGPVRYARDEHQLVARGERGAHQLKRPAGHGLSFVASLH